MYSSPLYTAGVTIQEVVGEATATKSQTTYKAQTSPLDNHFGAFAGLLNVQQLLLNWAMWTQLYNMMRLDPSFLSWLPELAKICPGLY